MKTKTKLKRIAWLSERDPDKEFHCLMHHVNLESLEESFNRLDTNKAVGVDGIDKETYGLNLKENLQNLLDRMMRMAYRPMPVKEVLIPKEGQPGQFRPLGISILEDKIVQGVFQQILESIYDPIFYGCSYGFRPQRSCHTAIKDLSDYLFRNKVEVILDIDLKNFFGTIDHQTLEKFLRIKIKDERFIRYIIRMFKAGILSKGELKVSEEGVPQGSIASPILANIFAHYVIDEWIEKIIQPYCRGEVKLLRYADDAIICFEDAYDAKRIKETLPKRLSRYKLELNEDKTKMVSFSEVKAMQGKKQGTFDFLGFTFYWGKSKRGRVIPKLKTSRKTMRNKLKKVKEWAKAQRNRYSLCELWKVFCRKLRGHIQYYGVSFNSESVKRFVDKAIAILFKWLNRRSQRKSFHWEQFRRYMKLFPPPKIRICHPLF